MRLLCDEHKDPSHDLLHVERVLSLAKAIAQKERGNLRIIVPATCLHDCVHIEKTDPRRSQASRLSAVEAQSFLKQFEFFSDQELAEIGHAVEAHSYSAKITPRSLEAKIVQDADRLDGLGALGIARCFSLGGRVGRSFYDSQDAFARNRAWDDSQFTVDHFYVKLFKVAETLHTPTAQSMGKARVTTMQNFLRAFQEELTPTRS